MPNINLATINLDIYEAAAEGNLQKTKELLNSANEAGLVDAVNAYVDPQTGNRALHAAAILTLPNLIDLLIKYGARVDYENKSGQTPLEIIQKKTSDHNVVTILANGQPCSINIRALKSYNLDFLEKIITPEGEDANVYGVVLGANSKANKLCIWIKGRSEPTILADVSDRADLSKTQEERKAERENKAPPLQQKFDELRRVALAHLGKKEEQFLKKWEELKAVVSNGDDSPEPEDELQQALSGCLKKHKDFLQKWREVQDELSKVVSTENSVNILEASQALEKVFTKLNDPILLKQLQEFKAIAQIERKVFSIPKKKSHYDSFQLSYFDTNQNIHVIGKDKKPIELVCSSEVLRDIFQASFLQRIEIWDNASKKLATIYGCNFANGKLCYLIDNQDYITESEILAADDFKSNNTTLLKAQGNFFPSILTGKGSPIKTYTVYTNHPVNQKNPLVRFQKYRYFLDSTHEDQVTFYGFSPTRKDKNKFNAIVLTSQGSLLLVEPEELFPLHLHHDAIVFLKNAPKITQSNQKPQLLTNLQMLFRYSEQSIIGDYAYATLSEAFETKQAFYELQTLLFKTKFDSVEALISALKKVLAERWERIKSNTNLSYVTNSQLPINQLYIHIAQLIDPDNKMQLLMPTIEYSEDTNGININELEFGSFILTNDGTQFIELSNLIANAVISTRNNNSDYYQCTVRDSVFDEKTHQPIITQKVRSLDPAERQVLFTLHPEAKQFDIVAQKKIKIEEFTVLGGLQKLRQYAQKVAAQTDIKNEFDVKGLEFYPQLSWVAGKYFEMDEKNREILKSINISEIVKSTDHVDSTLKGFLETRFFRNNPGELGANLQLSTNFCLDKLGGYLDAIMEKHCETLKTIPMGTGNLENEQGFEAAYTELMEVLKKLTRHAPPPANDTDENAFLLKQIKIEEIEFFINDLLCNTAPIELHKYSICGALHNKFAGHKEHIALILETILSRLLQSKIATDATLLHTVIMLIADLLLMPHDSDKKITTSLQNTILTIQTLHRRHIESIINPILVALKNLEDKPDQNNFSEYEKIFSRIGFANFVRVTKYLSFVLPFAEIPRLLYMYEKLSNASMYSSPLANMRQVFFTTMFSELITLLISADVATLSEHLIYLQKIKANLTQKELNQFINSALHDPALKKHSLSPWLQNVIFKFFEHKKYTPEQITNQANFIADVVRIQPQLLLAVCGIEEFVTSLLVSPSGDGIPSTMQPANCSSVPTEHIKYIFIEVISQKPIKELLKLDFKKLALIPNEYVQRVVEHAKARITAGLRGLIEIAEEASKEPDAQRFVEYLKTFEQLDESVKDQIEYCIEIALHQKELPSGKKEFIYFINRTLANACPVKDYNSLLKKLFDSSLEKLINQFLLTDDPTIIESNKTEITELVILLAKLTVQLEKHQYISPWKNLVVSVTKKSLDVSIQNKICEFLAKIADLKDNPETIVAEVKAVSNAHITLLAQKHAKTLLADIFESLLQEAPANQNNLQNCAEWFNKIKLLPLDYKFILEIANALLATRTITSVFQAEMAIFIEQQFTAHTQIAAHDFEKIQQRFLLERQIRLFINSLESTDASEQHASGLLNYGSFLTSGYINKVVEEILKSKNAESLFAYDVKPAKFKPNVVLDEITQQAERRIIKDVAVPLIAILLNTKGGQIISYFNCYVQFFAQNKFNIKNYAKIGYYLRLALSEDPNISDSDKLWIAQLNDILLPHVASCLSPNISVMAGMHLFINSFFPLVESFVFKLFLPTDFTTTANHRYEFEYVIRLLAKIKLNKDQLHSLIGELLQDKKHTIPKFVKDGIYLLFEDIQLEKYDTNYFIQKATSLAKARLDHIELQRNMPRLLSQLVIAVMSPGFAAPDIEKFYTDLIKEIKALPIEAELFVYAFKAYLLNPNASRRIYEVEIPETVISEIESTGKKCSSHLRDEVIKFIEHQFTNKAKPDMDRFFAVRRQLDLESRLRKIAKDILESLSDIKSVNRLIPQISKDLLNLPPKYIEHIINEIYVPIPTQKLLEVELDKLKEIPNVILEKIIRKIEPDYRPVELDKAITETVETLLAPGNQDISIDQYPKLMANLQLLRRQHLVEVETDQKNLKTAVSKALAKNHVDRTGIKEEISGLFGDRTKISSENLIQIRLHYLKNEQLRNKTIEFLNQQIQELKRLRPAVNTRDELEKKQISILDNAIGSENPIPIESTETLYGLKRKLEHDKPDEKQIQRDLTTIIDLNLIKPLKDLDSQSTIIQKIQRWFRQVLHFFSKQSIAPIDSNTTKNLYKQKACFFSEAGIEEKSSEQQQELQAQQQQQRAAPAVLSP